MEFHLTAADLPEYEAQARIDLQNPLKRRQSLTAVISDSLPSSLRIFNSLLYTSRYFTTNSLSLLFSSFPLTALQSVDNFALSFATYHHGFSLHSLYQLTSYNSPIILLLRSLEKKVVIGVYLDDSISPPGNEMRGKGKGGVFRLDEKKCIWYGTTTESFRKRNEKLYSELNERQSNIGTSETQGTETEDMTAEAVQDQAAPRNLKDLDDIYFQYCVAQLNALVFGGSLEHGTNAIRICSDLRTCSCGPSDTYQNPSLVPEESDPFLIGQLSFFFLSSLLMDLYRGCGSIHRSFINGRFY